MAEFDLDSIISGFEGKQPKAKSNALDVEGLLSGFKTSEPVSIEVPKKKVSTEPKPPISGLSKESSDEINSQRALKFGVNPRRMLPTIDIVGKIKENYEAGKDLLGEAATDVQSGHPYKGLGKGVLGLLSVVSSPATGLVEGGVGTPLTDITGNKAFGDKAALLTGAAVPVVPGAGFVVKNLPKNKSLAALVESIGPENLSTVVKEMKANPRLAPADLSPKVLQDTQHLFANDGPQINYLATTSANRMATRRSAVEEAYDTAGGISPNLAQKITDLANAAKDIGSKQINPLVKAAKPVDVTSTVNNIDAILKPGVMAKISEGSTLALPEVKQALSAARGWLTNGKELRTGAEDLHDIQKALRRQGYSLTKSANAGEREIGHALLKVRNDLVSDIDKASPGYAKALDSYREEMHIADAFKEGHDKIFSSSKKIENDPSFVKKWFDGLTTHEQEAAREGARAAIYTEMGVAKNPALAGESISRSDFNKAKMEILFGKEETDKLLKALDDERKIANTHNKIVENSQTAMRAASKEQFALPTKSEVGQGLVMGAGLETANILAHGYPGIGTATLGGAKAVSATKHAISTKIARERNAQYAKYALPTEGPSRDELIQALEAAIPKPKLSLASRARLALPFP